MSLKCVKCFLSTIFQDFFTTVREYIVNKNIWTYNLWKIEIHRFSIFSIPIPSFIVKLLTALKFENFQIVIDACFPV